MLKTPTKLSVNVNAVAYLRNRREVPWPNLLDISRAILDAGAFGITVHPRPDQRHIRFTDVSDLAEMIDREFPEAEFNIEGYPTEHFIELVLSVKAHQVTLVPDSPEQSTSDHGWDFDQHGDMLTQVSDRFRKEGLRVSYFVDTDVDAPVKAWETGADRIEFYTGPFANDGDLKGCLKERDRLAAAADVARQVGHNQTSGRTPLMMNAGHDLTLDNLPRLREAIPDLAEVSIGHGLTADALMLGFPKAVKRYLDVLS
ncbi:MAG: pyridoxine 5'-phosphate synthase [Rhodobacteraceae bacterium]|nr:pyridoxine 5'-phosphate synthase [Paracoccaceae bacterium]